MPFKKFYSVFILIAFIFINNQTYSQSLGIIYEASSFNLRDFYYNAYSNPTGLIKNLFINYNAPLSDLFIFSFKTGYGWNNYQSSYNDGNYKETNDEITKGVPVEAEIQFHHCLGKDSVFEPLLGIGLGYYHYISNEKASFSTIEHKYTSSGLTQYILIGMNINITSCLASSIQFKKIMINGISTKYESENHIEERDYSQGNGLDDIGVSFGIFYKCENQ